MNEYITTDADAIRQEVLTELESSVGEPLYPGDERRIFGEALVAVIVSMYNAMNDAARQKMLRYARGDVLDALGERVGVTRIAPTSATTVLRFSLTEAVGENVLIPQGTRVTNDSTHYFATTAAAVIPVGELHVDVKAQSAEGGTAYNGIPMGSINSIVDAVVYVDRVSNITETVGGGDEETDDSLRERIKAAPSKLSTAGPINGYKYWAMSADSSIIDVCVKSDKETVERTLNVNGEKAYKGGDRLLLDTLTVYKANGSVAAKNTDYTATYEDGLLTVTLTPSGALSGATTVKISIDDTNAGVVKIVPMCANGQIPDENILEKVAAAVNASEVRPLTDKVKVEAPQVEYYDIELTYYTPSDKESECIQTVEGDGGAIDKFNEWQSEELGRDINPDKLRALILAPADENAVGATRVAITSPTFAELDDTTVAKFSGNMTVRHEVAK